MRAKKIILAAMAASGSLSAFTINADCCCGTQGAADLAAELLRTPNYLADATFEVLLPQAVDPVAYDVTLQSAAATDTLSPCDYVIRWSSATSTAPLEGFSAYYDGHHYRYRNNRLQEYHAEANIQPFMPLGRGSEGTGVQSTAQFADMLPQMLGRKIQEMVADSSYVYAYHPDTLVSGRRSVVIDGVKRAAGYDQTIYTYVFDYDTHLPRYTEIESSPGAISEQIMTITYGTGSARQPVEISEEGLMDTWPEVFEKYRESTFRAENLVGTPLPEFACQILDGGSERYTHHAGEPFDRPVVLVVLDPNVSTTPEVIASLREALASAPMDIDVVWAFNSNNTSEIKEALGSLQRGETALTSANSLIRVCGITLFPTTVLVGRDSKVQDVIAGANNDLGLIVLQKAMLM